MLIVSSTSLIATLAETEHVRSFKFCYILLYYSYEVCFITVFIGELGMSM